MVLNVFIPHLLKDVACIEISFQCQLMATSICIIRRERKKLEYVLALLTPFNLCFS